MKSSIIFIVLLITQPSISQLIDSSFSYYPLQIGDIRQYGYYSLSSNQLIYNYEEVVTGDTIAQNNKRYYVITRTNLTDKSSSMLYLRVDTMTANVYQSNNLSSPNEMLLDSLRSTPGDRFGITSCTGIEQKTVLGFSTMVKSFSYSVISRHDLAYGIGRVSDWEEISSFPYGSTLIYAKINGNEYGTPLEVKRINIAPTEYCLEQNYPNPFNPSTIIRFVIPNDEMVKISICNMIGQEIEVLFEGYLSSGKHEIIWNGSTYSSGVYFYQLKTRNYFKTKSLMLLK